MAFGQFTKLGFDVVETFAGIAFQRVALAFVPAKLVRCLGHHNRHRLGDRVAAVEILYPRLQLGDQAVGIGDENLLRTPKIGSACRNKRSALRCGLSLRVLNSGIGVGDHRIKSVHLFARRRMALIGLVPGGGELFEGLQRRPAPACRAIGLRPRGLIRRRRLLEKSEQCAVTLSDPGIGGVFVRFTFGPTSCCASLVEFSLGVGHIVGSVDDLGIKASKVEAESLRDALEVLSGLGKLLQIFCVPRQRAVQKCPLLFRAITKLILDRLLDMAISKVLG